MIGYFVIFVIGTLLGAHLRGAFTKTAIGEMKLKLRHEQIQTQIERERVKQHRMLNERINQ